LADEGKDRIGVHSVEFVLETKITIILSGGIKDRADLPLARIQHGLEFALGWRSFADREFLKIEALSAQPVCRISARGAGLVGVDFKHVERFINGNPTQIPNQKP